MQFSRIHIILLLFIFEIIFPKNSYASNGDDIHKIWLDCRLEGKIAYPVFRMAFTGYQKIENLKKNNLLTIIDYSKPSTEKRFLVIDLKRKVVLHYCLVAHGRNSGDNNATHFSNQPNSLKSCLGFFITAETYMGKHGYSLRLDGIEKDYNSNARARDIVIHGADYVSEEYIKKYDRIGRSWGCPALPINLSKKIIDTISQGSCIFVYGIGYSAK